MKHSNEELLLANAVRNRAFEIRNGRTLNMTDAEDEEFRKKPLGPFLIEAFEELERIASLIADHRTNGLKSQAATPHAVAAPAASEPPASL